MFRKHLLQDANLWDVSVAPTIVMTQRGARSDFQKQLRKRGVEVVEFDFLTPHAVAAYCYERGFLQCLWECGGTLAAPAIAAGVIHKTLAFIAPKLVGHMAAKWHVIMPDSATQLTLCTPKQYVDRLSCGNSLGHGH